jgi:hypothetical protein
MASGFLGFFAQDGDVLRDDRMAYAKLEAKLEAKADGG